MHFLPTKLDQSKTSFNIFFDLSGGKKPLNQPQTGRKELFKMKTPPVENHLSSSRIAPENLSTARLANGGMLDFSNAQSSQPKPTPTKGNPRASTKGFV